MTWRELPWYLVAPRADGAWGLRRNKKLLNRVTNLMLQHIFRLLRVGLLPVLFIFGGCGGSDQTTTGSIDDPDIALSSLVVTGYDIDFSSDKTGPYEIQVPNSVSTLTLSPTANREGLIIDTRQTHTLGAVNPPFERITSGGSHQYTLAEGTNIIVVRVIDQEVLIVASYTLKVKRVSATASLLSLIVGNIFAQSGESSGFALNETFDPDTFTYTVSVPYENCTTYVVPYTNNASTALDLTTPLTTINDAVSSDPAYFDLQTGANLVSAELTSEDGNHSAVYNLTITRAEGSSAQVEANTRLSSLSISPGELTFLCGLTTYSNIYVNNNVSAIELVMEPENPAATITINDVAYVNGEPFEQALDSDGGTLVTIKVTSAGGSNTREYLLAILNSERNVVDVSTAAELQAALLNAAPNDEIRVAPGSYIGTASLATSGSDTAHFFSDQSGTADNPIFLVGDSVYEDSVLQGDDLAQNTVLELNGSYWVISGLGFENALNGIVLNAASNNVIRNSKVENLGAQALIMRNGSTSNVVDKSRFGNTGVNISESETGNAEAILIGSDDALWQTNPNAAGPYAEADNNNVIRSSFFASSIASESIEVNEGVVGTRIEYNTFESGSLTGQAEDTSLIRVQGNDTLISYNTFYHENDVNLESVIAIDDASEEWHSVNWGENSQIYQNKFLLSGANLPVVNANSTATYVAENVREDGGTVSYTGTGIDQSSLDVPVYQIRMASDETLCVASDELEVSETATVGIVRSQTCVDGDAGMQWKFLIDGDGYVRIQSVEDPELYLYPVSTFIRGCSADNFTQSMVRVNELGAEGLIYSWEIAYDEEDTLFINKSNRNFLLSALGDAEQTLQAGSPVLMCSATGHEFQRFRLVPQ